MRERDRAVAETWSLDRGRLRKALHADREIGLHSIEWWLFM